MPGIINGPLKCNNFVTEKQKKTVVAEREISKDRVASRATPPVDMLEIQPSPS
jgi:hypothetical protein